MQNPRKQLIKLGFNDSEVSVYLAMLGGVRSAQELVKVTGMKRPTVYYALGCLQKRGLVGKSGRENDIQFTVEPLQRLTTIAEEKENEARILKESITGLLPSLETQLSSPHEKPAVSFFEGTSAVKNVIMEIMYAKSHHIDCIAPQQNFFWDIGSEFVTSFVDERNKRNISTRNLWEKEIDLNVFRTYYNKNAEVKILPKVMEGTFSTTIFLYDNKTLYVSSLKANYAVLITSKEHYETMSALFEGLWSTSKPHTK